jgi:RNA polymerase primary sigma factor
LDKKDLPDLVRKSQKGDKGAREELILGNLWLVDRLAQELGGCPLPIEDRFSEGIFGLARAIQLFDPERDCLFSTYARYWIRHAILRAGDNSGRTIRITVCMVDRIRKVGKMQEAGTSNWEIQKKTGLSYRQLVELRGAAKLRQIQSLDAPLIQEEEAFSLADLVSSPVGGPDDLCQKEDLSSTLREALDALPPVDRRIVEIVYGLDDQQPASTIEQAAEILGLDPVQAAELMGRAMNSLESVLCDA